MTPPRIVGIGSVFIDDIVLPSGKTYMGQLGGGVTHALMGAAVWDEKPGIVAPIGQGLPAEARARLETHLDIRGLYNLGIPQIRAWQLFEEDGRRRELYRVQETAPYTDGAMPDHFPAAYRGSEGYYLLQGFEGARAWCGELGGFILWEPLQQVMMPDAHDALRAVLQAYPIDLVSPNLIEAQTVYGNVTPDELVDALLSDGAQRIALRMGAEGSLIADRITGERYHIPAAPVANILDQTGAGNTYCGGLLWGILSGKSLRDAGAAGAVSASFCLESIGVLDPSRVDRAERDRRYRLLSE